MCGPYLNRPVAGPFWQSSRGGLVLSQQSAKAFQDNHLGGEVPLPTAISAAARIAGHRGDRETDISLL